VCAQLILPRRRSVIAPRYEICKWRNAQTLGRRSLLSQYYILARHTGTCNFINARRESTALAAPLFMKLAQIQQHYVQTWGTEFHLVRTTSVESACSCLLTPQVRCGCWRARCHSAVRHLSILLWPRAVWKCSKSDEQSRKLGRIVLNPSKPSRNFTYDQV
jgi:hypothetical protein